MYYAGAAGQPGHQCPNMICRQCSVAEGRYVCPLCGPENIRRKKERHDNERNQARRDREQITQLHNNQVVDEAEALRADARLENPYLVTCMEAELGKNFLSQTRPDVYNHKNMNDEAYLIKYLGCYVKSSKEAMKEAMLIVMHVNKLTTIGDWIGLIQLIADDDMGDKWEEMYEELKDATLQMGMDKSINEVQTAVWLLCILYLYETNQKPQITPHMRELEKEYLVELGEGEARSWKNLLGIPYFDL